MLVTERNFRATLHRLAKHNRLIVDTETNGLYTWHGHRLIGISVCSPHAKREDCFYFPFRHQQGRNLEMASLAALLRFLGTRKLTGWNLKFDLHMLYADGMKEPPQIEDVMLLFHLLDENQWKTGGSYELKVAAESYVDQSARGAQLRLTNLLADRGLTKGAMDQLAPNDVAEYATDDVYYTERMRSLLLPALKEWDLVALWREINHYATIVRRFEERGVLLDVPLIEQYQAECRRKCARLLKKIQRSAGRDLNVRSNPQVQAWLGVPSTAADYLEEIQWTLTPEQNKNIELLQEYRQWDKALGTYYNKYMEMKDADGVLHPNIKLHATITGRPGSENPNMQAVPLYTEIYKVKDVIVARPGYTLVSADYSQMELRLGAHYAKDPILMKAFQEGRSPHKETQQELLDAGLEIDYTTAKNVNFSVLYGTGVSTLAKRYMKGNTKLAAQTLTAAHEKHPHYRPFLKQTEQVARNFGFIRMWTGRVRRFNTLKDPQPWFHKAGANLIQGGAMECLRIAIMRLDPILKKHDSHMLLQVYDQLLLEVPTKKVKKVARILRREMTRDFPFDVPLAVEIKVGQRWGKLEELK